MFVLLLVLAALVGFFLHRTAYGRYWYAIGHNELAAKYAGVNVNRQRTVVVRRLLDARCSGRRVVVPRHARPFRRTARVRDWNFTQFWARCWAGAVFAAAREPRSEWSWGQWCCRFSKRSSASAGCATTCIPAVIGLTLLFGTIIDELIRRRSVGRH